MAAIGEWAVDNFQENRLHTVNFKSRDEASNYARNQTDGCTMRRVNLEDAFLAMTGKPI